MSRKINPLQPILDQLPAPLKNKYFLTLGIFFFSIIFLNKITPFTQLKLHSTKVGLEEEKVYFQQKLEEVIQDRADNERHVEKFGREHYFMKKSDEDVFVFVKEEED